MVKEYFTEKELTCGCGCGLQRLDPDTRRLLNNARELAGIPFVVNSASRCEVHNAAVGGKPDSAHVPSRDKTGHCYAADIRFKNGWECFRIVGGALAAGFTRIGVSQKGGFVHMDNSPYLPQDVFFFYD
jgi:hypothetical protein